ncbi:MAG: YihY/virulence factor BrkB family protein [Dermatophilaceae bacterium]
MTSETTTGAPPHSLRTAATDGRATAISATRPRMTTWRGRVRSTVAEFHRLQCTDLAAALTYYAVLSLFPGLIALVSLLGVFGQGESTVEALLDVVRGIGQPDLAEQLAGPVRSTVRAQGAGFGVAAGLAGALWTASGYVGAFGRAMNRVGMIEESRPGWALRPTRLLITVGLVVAAALVLVGVVVGGDLARTLGDAIGVGEQFVTVWDLARWPVVLATVVVMVAVLYSVTPSARRRFRWVSLGALVAILTWALASLAFSLYVDSFATYNRTYGSLAGVVVFLLWLWITNVALLFGAVIDTEREHVHQPQPNEPTDLREQPPRGTGLPIPAESTRRRAARDSHRPRRGRPDTVPPTNVELEPLPSDVARVRGR